jgi:hypothetical protein
MSLKSKGAVPGSFRDPDGFVFLRDGVPHRQINESYRAHYDLLMESGLYDDLAKRGALISHQEVPVLATDEGAYKILRPDTIPFISFPYEWCFSQLKDAALLTLEIQERALEFGMTLKDASAYNVQFHKGRPVFIDTLSLETYRDGSPWAAYRQFCQHFLAPLCLMSGTDARLAGLSRVFLDGVPLDLAASLLPASSRLKPGQLLHIHLHAKSQKAFSGKTEGPEKKAPPKMSKLALTGLVRNLRKTVEGLRYERSDTEWGDYYDDNSYSGTALSSKRTIVADLLGRLSPASVWDLGANSGLFSRLASSLGITTLSFDLDHTAVEASYRACRKNGETNILPLVLDLTNPSPAIGWANRERPSLLDRGPAETVLALALIHHLAISNNLPFWKIAEFFRDTCRFLILEFVPKSDVQVQRLLRTRPDIFPEYHEQGMIDGFSAHFSVRESHPVAGSDRKIFLMEKLPA